MATKSTSRGSGASKSTRSTGKKKSTSSRSAAGKGRSGTSKSARSSSNRSRSTAKKQTSQAAPIRREVWSLICLLLAIFAGLGYFHIKAVFITFFCNLLKGLFGYGFWFAPPALLLTSGILMFHRGKPVRRRVVCTLLLPFLLGALLHLLIVPGQFKLTQIAELWQSGLAVQSGGALSGWFSVLFSTIFSRIGAAILFLLALFFCNMAITKITPVDIWDGIVSFFRGIRDYVQNRPAYEEVDYFGPETEEDEPEPVSTGVRRVRKPKKHTEPEPDPDDTPVVDIPGPGAQPEPRKGRRTDIDIPLDDDAPFGTPEQKGALFDDKPGVRPPHEFLEDEAKEESQKSGKKKKASEEPEPEVPADLPEEPVEPEETAKPKQEGAAVRLKPIPTGEKKDPSVGVSEQQRKSEAAIAAEKVRRKVDSETYQYPSVDLLDKATSVSNADATAELQQTRELLDDTIQSFGIDARIVNVTRGPSVTRFELELMRGVKLNKLTGISEDIALALGAPSVRIAPITGRNSVVGIEIPNQLVTPVPIREVIDSKEFRTHVSKVAFAVGKDISGKNVVGNIAKLPHMLIAGTTGSGKSVCTNSLIISLLYKSSPEDVRLIMVDPKMVELGIYNGIPHLLIPVVTDPKKAAGALQWAVTEMMKRYRAFSEIGVRDLASYNAHMMQNEGEKLPQIVVVIDELADLMLVAAKEVEESICRVAQMGRAAGMHLVIATQRPSSDVITGLMKANIPSRIAFAVASSLESRIILDTVGAEKLVGKGDMLYAPLGMGKPQRVQGCMISDEEVARVVEFIKQNSAENYDNSVMEEVESSAKAVGTKGGKGQAADNSGGKSSGEDAASDADELLPQAIEVVVETGMASVSMLQRRLKLGYSRAARLVDQMEERKIVGPFEGSKPRQVLITKEQWAAKKQEYLGSDALPGAEEFREDEFAEALAMSEAADAEADMADPLDAEAEDLD